MKYCEKHGIWYDYSEGCPECGKLGRIVGNVIGGALYGTVWAGKKIYDAIKEENVKSKEEKTRKISVTEKEPQRQEEPRKSLIEPTNKPVEITTTNFEQYINSGYLIVLEFCATWCGVSKAIEPIIKELAREYMGKAVIGKLNTDNYPKICEELGVKNIPTIIFVKNGVIVDYHVGYIEKNVLVSKIEKVR